MTISAKVILDSLAPCGARLTTMEITYPRIILAEFNTHRALSRNSASSRAIPTKKMREMVVSHYFSPIYWGKNQAGMQAAEEIAAEERKKALLVWQEALEDAARHHQRLEELGVHKQIANRLLEPWMWVTSIVSATSWNNLFWLRCHKDAQPEFQALARAMRKAYKASSPEPREGGDWHLPYIDPETAAEVMAHDRYRVRGGGWTQALCKVSAARCARVSYLTHDGKRDPWEDLNLFDRLMPTDGGPVHASPLEHVAQALSDGVKIGNFTGWLQLRKTVPGESGEYAEVGDER